ncbi:hypothetical protein C7B65_06455 [Phormidesmis priestleyi ULC007]|uniref:Uncharacterized protein n=2 Tax=Phormidesmis priestleyi TaxID=268141 RepID=A0A2T1DJ93_9CYAN|nr:hypothetical protein C7B65_06455 [Phormidesmis priestleyi ULC007]PZO54212.1 MAG: hypothetical protein DCF14_02100 [Phormidesmis priestleyi]
MSYRLTEWQAHVLTEVGGILAGILEFDRPIEVAIRLKAIAADLEQAYGDDPPLIPPSNRLEVPIGWIDGEPIYREESA